MSDSIPITPSGFKKIKEELKRLKTIERPQNIKDIETAIAHGDLSENAEYSAAKEKQSHISGRMGELGDAIARAEVIDPAELKHDKVYFGATVRLNDTDTDEEMVYQIVGKYESDVKAGRISVESPLARSLIGKSEDDLIKMKTRDGFREYEILEILYK